MFGALLFHNSINQNTPYSFRFSTQKGKVAMIRSTEAGMRRHDCRN